MLSTRALAQLAIGVVFSLLVWTVGHLATPPFVDTDELVQYVHNKLISPLRRVPGPFLASMTEYWLVMIDLAGLRTLTIHRLHQKYGPVVRVGPNEVWFDSQEAFKAIYGGLPL